VRIGFTYDLKGSGGAEGIDDEEEYDSPETIDAIAAVFEGLGHRVLRLGSGRSALERLLQGGAPDLVFNIAEGRSPSRSREAQLPAVLEMLGIPFIGSDAFSLAVSLDKDCAKRLVASAGVATPAWVLARGGERAADFAALGLPCIVKPAWEGSSKGVLGPSLVREHERVPEVAAELVARYRQPALVEEFIDGDELTVGVVGNDPPEVLGILRVLPRDARGPFVYDLEVKRDWERRVTYEAPAALPPAVEAAVRRAALAAFDVLGCRDLARIDFRLKGGVPYFLEANPLPGLSPISGDLVILARGLGIAHEELVARVLDAACARLGLPGRRAGAAPRARLAR